MKSKIIMNFIFFNLMVTYRKLYWRQYQFNLKLQCKDVRLLCVLEGEFRPFTGLFTWIKMRATDTRLSDQHVCEELRRAPTLPPHPLRGGLAYITSTDLPREHSSTKSPGRTEVPAEYQVGWIGESPEEDVLTSLQGAVASGQVNLSSNP